MTERRDGPQSAAGMAGVAGFGATPVGRQAAFRAGFVWVALAVAVGGGFGLAAHLSFVIGFGYPLGPAFPALVQAHGHAQLVGWAGMFVVGVSLHFIPRLASVPLTHPHRIDAILWLMGTGLALRVVGQPTLAYGAGPVPFDLLRWFVVASGALEGGASCCTSSSCSGVCGEPARSGPSRRSAQSGRSSA